VATKVNWTFRWQDGEIGNLTAGSRVAAILLAKTLRRRGHGVRLDSLTRDPYLKVFHQQAGQANGNPNP
jgi:hypothetical protein